MSMINSGVIGVSAGSKLSDSLYVWVASKLNEREEANTNTTKIFGRNYTINITYKFINMPTLNVDSGEINIILPRSYKKYETEKVLSVLLNKMYLKLAREEVEKAMEKYRILLGMAPEDYEVKHLNGYIAKCSNDKTIIIDPRIVIHNKHIIEYVVLHQICHLKYRTHARGFYEMLKKYMPEYRMYERELDGLKY